MAWYTDEQYAMIQDSREKKSVAASAFKQRSHCGKGGRVRLPSDNMSKKELNAMNGECKSYRMNDPISWSEFVEWPNEHKVAYISRLREKFGVGDKIVAEMFDVSCHLLLMYVKELGMETKPDCDADWNREKFYAWRSGARTELVGETVEEVEERKTYEWSAMTWAEFKLLPDDKKIEYIKWIRETFDAPNKVIAEMLGVHRTYFAKDVISRLNLNLGAGSGRNKRNYDNPEFKQWCEMKAEAATAEPLVIDEPTEIIIPCISPLMTVKEENTEETINTDELFQKHVENIGQAEQVIMDSIGTSVKPQEAVQPEIDIPVKENKTEEHSSCETHCEAPIEGQMRFQGNADDILRTIRMLTGGKNVSLYVEWRVMEE